MVMEVKKATFQRIGNSGKGRTENRWDVSGAWQSAPLEVYISTVTTSKRVGGWPSERRQNCSWWHCRVLFCEINIYCYFTPSRTYTSNPVEESVQFVTAPYLVLFQLRSVGILCSVCRNTRHHTKRPQFQCCSPWAVSHPQLWPTPAPTKSRCSVRIASAIVVLNSTNSKTVRSFKLSV